MEHKNRLDLVVSGMFEMSRSAAKELIEKGLVTVNGKQVDSPGAKVLNDWDINVRLPETAYVSRGGYKLEKALSHFGVSVLDLVCADVGASTGGFTDCLLQNGAKKVFAIDNGSNQLDERLKTNSRVINIENVNAKDITLDITGEPVDFVSIDLSFISVTKVLSAIKQIIKPDGLVVCLIKPQFEAGREFLSRSGIVRDKSVHEKVVQSVLNAFSAHGFKPLGVTPSPITGGKGNIEYLSCFLLKGD